jgi:hypothetical protein
MATLKGETDQQKLKTSFGTVDINTNDQGHVVITIQVRETHIVKHYVFKQRKDNTLSNFQAVIGINHEIHVDQTSSPAYAGTDKCD